MKRNKFVLMGSITIFLGSFVFGRTDPTQVMQVPNPAHPDTDPITVTVPVIPASTFYKQLSPETTSKEEALKTYLENLRHDPQYEGKVSLSFYGKVVDENNQPVAGASARLMWNTIAVPGGTAFKRTPSDENGLFSLVGMCGKCLGVRVEKPGYYTVDGGKGEVNFEYAEPSSPDWYEPDSTKPHIFHLRKEGPGAKLFRKTLNFLLNPSHPQNRINLIQGFIKPDGVLTVTSDTSKSLPGAQPFPWTVTLTMGEGGLVETGEQFPFKAPTSGYASSMTMDMTNLDRSVWRGDITKKYYFYLPSTNTYGRLTVHASSSVPIELDYAYNLTPGSQVLEPATSH